MARQLLSYFQGAVAEHACADQRKLRHIIPEDRKRAYDMRAAIELVADTGSFLELRRAYGKGMITGFMRIEGRPFGLIANNPAHLGGAIDAEAAEKAGRFVQLCDAFGLPIVSFCDTPGFMVGPEHEKFATVRRLPTCWWPALPSPCRCSWWCCAKATVWAHRPWAWAVCMCRKPSWPADRRVRPDGAGGRGAARLFKEIAAAGGEGTEGGDALFNKLLGAMIDNGKALNAAMFHEIDAVIDPRDTRAMLLQGLKTMPPGRKGGSGRRAFIPTW